MEIQTFFLALEVRQQGPGDYTAVTACISQFAPPDGEFPLQVRLPYLMLLRRSRRDSDEPIALRFHLIDEDGRPAGSPSGVRAIGEFPAGHRTLLLAGHIAFEFPAAGCYRLDVTADEETSAHLYSYDLEIGPGPEM